MLAGIAISKIPFGWISDKIGRRKIVIVSWVAETTVVYLFVYATSFPIAVLGIALWILFGAMDSPAINAWVAETTDPRTRGLSMGVFYTITYLPTVPALVVSGYLFALRPQFPFSQIH